MFEQLKSYMNSLDISNNWYSRLLNRSNTDINKQNFFQNKNQLSLADSEVKVENIKMILEFNNVQVPPHLKIDALGNMLLEHCSKRKSTFSVCFVPD